MATSHRSEETNAQALRVRIAQLERELDAAHQRLERLDELDHIHTELAFAISHELRTPLTLISGYAQKLLLRWGKTDEDRRHAMVQKINISSHRLSRLVDDILLMTDVERGMFTMYVRSLPIAEAASEAVREVCDRYPERLPTITISGGGERALVDGFRLEQVLICLLDNAVKHAPSGSTITLSWRHEAEQIVVAVRDHGSGIDPDDIPRLFTRFGRLEQTIGQSRGGIGLGLYIARRLVEAMQGRIWVESERGNGSTFYVAVQADRGDSR